jgi:subtilisin family serine protease
LRLPPIASNDTFIADEVLATVTTGTPLAVDDQIAQIYGLVLLDRQPLALLGSRLLRYRIPDGRPVATLVAQLSTDPRVFGPQPNFIYRQQNDPARALSRPPQYGIEKISAPAAHSLAHGRGVLVAVIDSAVDIAHPDVGAAVTKSFDAVGEPMAPDIHGTAIAGIIAGRGTVAGVAPEARLLSARAFVPGNGRRQGRTTTAVLLRAFDWSATEGARVFNLSFAGPRDPLVHQSLLAAIERRIVIVAAAGNGGAGAPSAFPAAYGEVIAVTAIDADDRLYEHANRGAYVSVAAPGVDVLVPAPGSAHDMQSGTSFAAAFTSGVAALMLERNPGLKAADLKQIVMRTAADLGAPGVDNEFGAGRINALASVEQSASAR